MVSPPRVCLATTCQIRIRLGLVCEWCSRSKALAWEICHFLVYKISPQLSTWDEIVNYPINQAFFSDDPISSSANTTVCKMSALVLCLLVVMFGKKEGHFV